LQRRFFFNAFVAKRVGKATACAKAAGQAAAAYQRLGWNLESSNLEE
jgi:hypothetical protein